MLPPPYGFIAVVIMLGILAVAYVVADRSPRVAVAAIVAAYVVGIAILYVVDAIWPFLWRWLHMWEWVY